MGTSLSVAPVSYIPMILRNIPSIFINVDAVPGSEVKAIAAYIWSDTYLSRMVSSITS